ncbi:uncharacterized protein J3D65DRAFT_406832 [Phyllosticta citribraziliensis]|uniref:Uncharacterized protein n=1 Tax=Phyllosticta citribraziliensis TaxID=989973 RepID=A0ABR1LNR6_9PEZI
METKDFSARLRFLDDSARLLSFGAPETSSFLEAQHDRLLVENGMAVPELRRREVCGACGTILIPGHSCRILQERKQPAAVQDNGANGRISKQKGTRKAVKGGDGKEKVYVCSKCHSETRIPLPTPKARMNKMKKGTHDAAAETSESGVEPVAERPVSSVANVGSKKRAKARKGGLQAMLASSRKENKPASQGFGLDLMDLMRSA